MYETINALTEQLFPGKSAISDVLSVTGNQIRRLQLVELFRGRVCEKSDDLIHGGFCQGNVFDNTRRL